jgi:hypothetical protein
MIKRTKQNWIIGSTVKVGFMTLKVIGITPTPGDFMPDLYTLESLDGKVQYEFVPHNGLTRITPAAKAPQRGVVVSACEGCNGSGESIGSQLTPCADCGGHGRQVVLQ